MCHFPSIEPHFSPSGPPVQGGQNQLLGQCVWLRHVLHPAGCDDRAPRGCGGGQAGGGQLLPNQGGGLVHRQKGGLGLLLSLHAPGD